MADEPVRYSFGGVDRTGLIMGLRAGQVGVLFGGLLLALLAIRSAPDLHGFAAGVAAIAGCTSLAFVKVEGRTAEQWVPVIASGLLRRPIGGWTYTSTAPTSGRAGADGPPPSPPPALAGVRILDAVAPSGDRLGLVHDRRAGTYSAVLPVRGRSFHLADSDDVERRLLAWGGALQALAVGGTDLFRLQWIDRAVPDDGSAMHAYLAARAAETAPAMAADSYAELLHAAGPVTQQHETMLVVTVSAARSRRAIRAAGGGTRGAAAVVARLLDRIRVHLRAADVDADAAALDAHGVSAAMRLGFDPSMRGQVAARTRAHPELAGLDEASAWPIRARTHVGCYEADGWLHATYWITDLPRRPVDGEFLAWLLMGTTAMRTVSVTMAPVDPFRANRDVENALTQRLADEQLRAEKGFRPSARRAKEHDAVLRREEELAEGHGDYRFSAYVTVTAPDAEALEDAAAEVRQAANQSGLVLAPLRFQQDAAFTSTLPLGRGVTGR